MKKTKPKQIRTHGARTAMIAPRPTKREPVVLIPPKKPPPGGK